VFEKYYQKIFGPIVKYNYVSMILAKAAAKKIVLKQFDIKTFFFMVITKKKYV